MASKRKILIAEPDTPFYDILRYNLVKRLYDISRASSGAELIEKAIAEQPDLLFLDYHLGDMDVFAAVAAIKEKQAIKKPIPTILVSPLVDEETIRKAAELQITNFLAVPFDLDDVIERIENLLGTEKVFEIIRMRGTVILELKGSIGHYHGKTLKNILTTLFGAGHAKIIVDLSRTDFLAHQLLMVFLSARVKVRQMGGKLVFCGLNEGIQILFKRAMMIEGFEIHPDRAAALRGV